MRWIKDEAFVRGSLPMTKFDARILAIALLEIKEGDVLLDVGAGTGSVSVEAALQGATVYAMEKDTEGVRLIRENGQRFAAGIHIINKTAPEGIDELPLFNKCFIGGSGGHLKEIFYRVNRALPKGGILAGNFIRLENACCFKGLLTAAGYQDIEVRQIQSSILDACTGIFKGQNPVILIRGRNL